MNQHLSSKRIAGWTIEDHSAEEVQHIQECTECAAQVERLAETLGMFRVAVRETAANFVEQRQVLQMPRRRMAVLWLTVAAALMTLAVVPVYRVQENRQKAAEMARQDAELMEQVNAELSEGVAAPMKPLEKMVSWGPTAKSAGEERKF
jgi:predicted anti-sigma-YlaC factor YlaD